jgi:hypothetical protein
LISSPRTVSAVTAKEDQPSHHYPNLPDYKVPKFYEHRERRPHRDMRQSLYVCKQEFLLMKNGDIIMETTPMHYIISFVCYKRTPSQQFFFFFFFFFFFSFSFFFLIYNFHL